MQFDDAGNDIVNVTWYFTKDDAPIFKGGHLFGSANWVEEDNTIVGIGERWDSLRPWYNGSPPFCNVPSGKFCGKEEWYFTGVPDGSPVVQYRADGTPTCCEPCPCQPWFLASSGNRTFTTNNPALSWVNTVEFPDTSEWFDFATGSSMIASVSNTPCPPGDSGTTLNIQLEPSGESCILHLIDYDPATNEGHYEWDPTLVGPPGFVATWKCPPM